MEFILNTLYNKIINYTITLIFTLMQSKFIHKIKYFTNQLFLTDLTENEFNSTWKIVCLKKYDGTMIDPTMPLKNIKEQKINVVYTLTDGKDYVYFPVFYSELDFCKDSIYDIFKYRLSEQISDYTLTIDEKYNNLFGKDYQYFIPYFIDNDFIDKLNNMAGIAFY